MVGDYQFIDVPQNPQQGFQDSVQTGHDVASRTPDQFQNEINSNVKSGSNLMGPSDGSDPMSDALSARARNTYESQVNSMARESAVPAYQRQNKLIGSDLQNQAAIYSSMQQRKQLSWQQTSFARAAALKDAQMTQQVLGTLFKGAGSVVGIGAAKGWFDFSSTPAQVEGLGGEAANPGATVATNKF